MGTPAKKALAFGKLLDHPNRGVPSAAIHAGGLELHVHRPSRWCLRTLACRKRTLPPHSQQSMLSAYSPILRANSSSLKRRTRNPGRTFYLRWFWIFMIRVKLKRGKDRRTEKF